MHHLKEINSDFEQSFKLLFDLSPDGFLISDLTGKVQYISDSGKKMFGIDDEDIEKGIILFDYVHEDDKERARNNNIERLKGNYNTFSEYRVIRKDGSCFWNETNAAFLKDSNGNPKSLFVVFRDITERKEHEAILAKYTDELKEINSIKDRFFSIIAHDLKNPFNGIMSFSELLLEQLNNNNIGKSIEYAKIIKEASVRGQNLLNNLLDWSRLQTGKIKINYQLVSLKNILDDVTELLMPNAIEKEIKISKNYDNDINIQSDKAVLSTIFRNFINNAIKFTHSHGEIRIKTSFITGQCNILIEDNGIGISEERLKKLFKVDSIFSTPGTKNETGTGLGLILCKDFVNLLKGEIKIESELGVGSKVTVTLPISKE